MESRSKVCSSPEGSALQVPNDPEAPDSQSNTMAGKLDRLSEGSVDFFQPYFKDVAQLRLALHRVGADHEFRVDRGGEISYVLDANIVKFFIDARNPNEATIIRKLDINPKVLPLVSILTAEYLFSGLLPGQAKPATLRITSDHASQLARMAQGLVAAARAELKRDSAEHSGRRARAANFKNRPKETDDNDLKVI